MRITTTVVFMMIMPWLMAQAPTSDFSALPLEVCIGESVDFTDLSVPDGSPIDLWTWDFGDGNSSNLLAPSHTYLAPGTYTVTLVVTAQNGQADAEVKVDYVTVHDLPSTGFTTSGNGCTVPFDVTFTNTSVTGANLSYDWDFGNTQTSTLESPSPVTYSAAGTYNVNLIVTNTVTGCSNSFSESIDVSDYSAAFTMPVAGCVGDFVPFTDGSTVGTNQWLWDFGDGQTSNLQVPTHSYGAPGTYTVTLTAQNTGSGCTDVITQDITINALPIPSFTADVTSGCAPLGVTFTNTSVGGVTYNWDFGNGNTFTGANPLMQQYTNDGVYTVSLTMIDANGCSGTFTAPNLIDVSAPDVQFSMDQYNGCEPLTVQFTDGSTSPNPIVDPITTWLWDFGDGSPIESGQFPPSNDYSEGVYSVTLTVFTQSGCQASLTLQDTIQVGSIANVNFSVNPNIECAKTPIDFIDSTTFNGSPSPGEVDYYWDFGDGGVSNLQSPTYEYPADTGYFDVQLVVDWRGCLDTLIMDSAVYIKAPISIFNPDQTLYCNPGSFPVSVGVTDNSIIGTIPDDAEMVWKWGDGTTTNFDDPDFDDADLGSTTHDYNAYGSYIIEQVIINNTTGCSDSTSTTVHISQTIADFTVSDDSTCVGSPVTLTSTTTSTHPLGTYIYDMGNGGAVTGSPANFTYNAWGQFDILLTATNNVGCSDTVSFFNMNALALPQASFTSSDVTGCAPILVTNTNNSTVVGNGMPLSSFLWTHPDLSSETTSNVAATTNYLYTTEGSFTTSMVAFDDFGCVSPTTSVNMVVTKPTADFVLDSVLCDLETFTAVNISMGATSYEWFLDGSSIAITTDYSSSFDENTSGTSNSVLHAIDLVATDANGCLDTLSQEVIVSMPRAEFDFILTGANVNAQGDFTCPPVFASFTDLSDSYGSISSWDWDFGDGKFSTLQDPNNTYVFSGTYSASLSIIDEFGCAHDTILVDYLSISGPSGDPDWTDLGDICGQTYIYEATNLVNVSEIIWDMGNYQTISDTNSFNYTYPAYDTYFPTATLIDSLGCEVVYPLDSIEVISNGLDAYFEPTPSEGPMGSTFILDDYSIFTTSPIVFWEWQFYNDTIVNPNGSSVIQPYGLPGIYPITLVVTDANGCFDTYYSSVEVTDDFHLPNVITANEDGVNDEFVLPVALFESFDIVIINRWGNVIHEHRGATGTLLWDGKTQGGVPVTDGTYFYKLVGTVVNGEQASKEGFVQVFH